MTELQAVAVSRLVWFDFDQARRLGTIPKTTCIFSDGVASFFVGWWSPTEGTILIGGGSEMVTLSPGYLAAVTHWAKLENMQGMGANWKETIVT